MEKKTMFSEFKDYGIIILKPDGVKHGLMNECEHEFALRNIKIISKKRKLLTREEIENHFYYTFDSYIDYMCEDYICAYFLESQNLDLDKELYLLKRKIRDNHGVNGRQLRNYIHSAHCGSEFFLQRRLLFPELEQHKFTFGCDMYCKLNTFTLDSLHRAMNLNNLSYLVFDFPKEYESEFCNYVLEKDLKKFSIYSYTQKINIQNRECELIHYCSCFSTYHDQHMKPLIFLGKISDLTFNNNTNSSIENYNLAYTIYTEKILDNIINELRKQNIDIKGLLVNSPNMCLQEAECRFEYAKAKKYLLSGGSSTIDNLGIFSISYDKVKPLIYHLEKYK